MDPRGKIRFVLVISFVVVSAGCRSRHVSLDYHYNRPVHSSLVGAAHKCTRDCHNHCLDDGRVVVLREHRHGPACGHRWDGAHWVHVQYMSGRGPYCRVCRRNCHRHYYDGDRLVITYEHRQHIDGNRPAHATESATTDSSEPRGAVTRRYHVTSQSHKVSGIRTAQRSP